MHLRLFILAFLIIHLPAQSSFAWTYIGGKEVGSIEREKILKAQQETSELVRTQIKELKQSNSLLKQDLEQRIRTISVLHDQVDQLKKANDLKQKELDSHKYDGIKNFGWIIFTILMTLACEHIWLKFKEKRKR